MSRIREMLPGEYGLLDEFLYQAIHTEPDEPRPPRSVTADPTLRAYVEGFGRTGDVAVCAEEGGEVVGAAWARLMCGVPSRFLRTFRQPIGPPSGTTTRPAASRPDSASSPTRSRPRT